MEGFSQEVALLLSGKKRRNTFMEKTLGVPHYQMILYMKDLITRSSTSRSTP